MPSLLLTALLAAPLEAPACPIERIVYRLQGAPEISAGFKRETVPTVYASDLALWLKTPARTYWFAFASPNGYGGTYIGPGRDPAVSRRLFDEEVAADARGETQAEEPSPEPSEAADTEEPISIEFDAFRADLSTYESPPQSSDPAPARLFARGLGPALWYNPSALAGGDPSATPESIPIAMFEPAGCDAARP